MVALGWFLIRCLHERTQISMQGGDILLRFLLIWAVFLPLNAAWSLGARRKKINPIPKRSVICNAATAALLAQTAIIYISSAITKSTDAWWTTGDLLWWDLQDPILTTSLGARLLAYPDLLPPLIRSGYLLEWAALPLAFFPWRTATIRILLVFAMWGFHLLGIGLIFNLALFPWVSAASWIVFLPTSFWDRLESYSTSAFVLIPAEKEAQVIAALPRAATLLVTCILVGIVGWNASWIGIHRMGKKFPKWMADYARSVPIHQGWDLFCYAPKSDARLVIVGTTADGNVVDLQHIGSTVVWGQEGLPPVTSPTYRWRRYINRISEPRYEEGSKHYADYLCRRWEEQTGEPLVKAELWRVIQYRYPPDGSSPKPTEKKLFYTLNWREAPNDPANSLSAKP